MRRAFTIIELLIVIFIFSLVLIMTLSTFTKSFIAGRTRSTGSMEANRSLSAVLDLIGQQMANATDLDLTSYGGIKVYGFHEDDNHMLTIPVSNVLSDPHCVIFRLNGTAIEMLQSSCPTNPAGNNGWEKISSPDIKITEFNLSQKNEWNSTTRTAPYLTVKIVGEDSQVGGKTSLETTYNIPAYTYNKW